MGAAPRPSIREEVEDAAQFARVCLVELCVAAACACYGGEFSALDVEDLAPEPPCRPHLAGVALGVAAFGATVVQVLHLMLLL